MHFRKLVSIWALLALMLGQFALAQHSATHADHGFSIELASSHDDDHNHPEDDKSENHQCPECVLTQSLQTAFYNAVPSFISVVKTEILTPAHQSFVVAINRYNSNTPRAPPAILI